MTTVSLNRDTKTAVTSSDDTPFDECRKKRFPEGNILCQCLGGPKTVSNQQKHKIQNEVHL